jgi:flagellar basal body-associated protein FliL
VAEEQSETQPETQKKGKKRLVVTIVILLGTVAIAGVGGAILGGRLISSASAGPADAENGEGEDSEAPSEDAPVEATFAFAPPIVVDFTDDGDIRHLKIGISVEVANAGSHGTDELQLYVPRGREAVISYARTLTFDEATSPKEFDRIRKELSEHVIKAMGEDRVSRVVITDYVAQ